MSSIEVRPFRRSDRSQLTQLVNSHAEAVVPGMVASVSTVLSSLERQDVIGYVEVETLDEGERLARRGGWADVGALHVTGRYRRRGVATWLLGQAADWLQLAQAERLLDYAWLDGTDPGGLDYAGYRAFLPPSG
jgi:GNAT superfamily N-acetyltransferase